MNNPEDRLNANALILTTALLLAFASAFFLYYGLNTMNDLVGLDPEVAPASGGDKRMS